jgi:hypothetical protein
VFFVPFRDRQFGIPVEALVIGRLCTGSIDEYGRAFFFGPQYQTSLKA